MYMLTPDGLHKTLSLASRRGQDKTLLLLKNEITK